MGIGERKCLYLGCVADDFTGASDAASFLVKGGIKTYLFNGIPKDDINLDCAAVVIALKTRTVPAKEAVQKTLEAYSWLESKGALQLYYKYCSTFDSTPRGNIGPVVDAVIDKYKLSYTVLCPSLLENERTVKDGRLYVKGVPLNESPMKDHPLTPMWSSEISELMREQGKYQCIQISTDELMSDKNSLRKRIETVSKSEPVYFVPDYYEEQHGEKIAEIFSDIKFLTGGSGLMSPLSKRFSKDNKALECKSKTRGKGLILVGSCSKATLSQIEHYKSSGHTCYKIDPLKVLSGEHNVENVWEQLTKSEKDDILVYSSDKAENIKKVQMNGIERVAEQLEALMSALSVKAVKAGYKRIVVGGGETSGAVTKALGYEMYQVGESIAPGVPILVPLNEPNVRLVLKSGNFGQEDFFERAINTIKL